MLNTGWPKFDRFKHLIAYIDYFFEWFETKVVKDKRFFVWSNLPPWIHENSDKRLKPASNDWGWTKSNINLTRTIKDSLINVSEEKNSIMAIKRHNILYSVRAIRLRVYFTNIHKIKYKIVACWATISCDTSNTTETFS